MIKIFLFFTISIIFFGCSKEKAIISDSESVKTLHFVDNDIRYYEKVFYKSYGDPNSKADFAEVNIEYPELISNRISSDSINQFVLDYLLNLPFNEDHITSFDEIADSLISNYISVQQEFEDYHTGWYIHANSNITGVFNNIISITSEEVIYTGGANTYYNLTYSNFDLNSGQLVSLDSIVFDNNFTAIDKIGKELFIEMKNIQPNLSFEDAGFWFEDKKFSLNENFAITDSGLVFFYNLYEIAPRSEGTTQLFIPKEKLNSLTNIY